MLHRENYLQTPRNKSDPHSNKPARLYDLRNLDMSAEERLDRMRLTAMRRRPGLLYGQHLYTHY